MKLVYTPDGFPYWIPEDDEQPDPSHPPDATDKPLPAFQPDKEVPPALQQFNPAQEPNQQPQFDIEQPLPTPPTEPVSQQFSPPAGYEDAPDLPAPTMPVPSQQQPNAFDPIEALFPTPLRQMAKGATTDAVSGIMQLGGQAVGAAAGLSPLAAVSPAYKSAADQLGPASVNAAEALKQRGAQLFDVNPAPTGLERAANVVGGSVMPAGKATIPLAAAGTAMGYIPDAVDALFPSAGAAPNPNAPPPSPNTVPVESTGGPTELSKRELMSVGILAAATIGMMFGPRVYQAAKAGLLPRLPSHWTNIPPRNVSEAVPGTQAVSNLGDLLRTYDDANAGIMRVLQRMGASPQALKEVEQTFAIQTRATANGMAEAAINTGRMDTPNFQFVSKMPLAELAKVDTKATSDYMHALQTIEDIKVKGLANLTAKGGATPGPIKVRGMTLADATAVKKALEQSNPEVVPFAKSFAEIHQAMRKFENAGEYAIMSTQNYRYLNSNHKYDVPFIGPRVLGEPVKRDMATKEMAEEMMKRLRKRMENEAVGMYVDAARRANPNSFKPTTIKQVKRGKKGRFFSKETDLLKDNPNWRKNTVSFYRRGKLETYTTDPFIADVLNLDPYVMSGMFANMAYLSKRWIEVGTTGELAPWFAVTNMIRSWQIGKLTAEEGFKSPSAFGTLAAIPRQLAPQIANFIGETLKRGSNGWLSQVFPQQALQGLSQRLGNYYTNSLWMQLNHAGGGRGSILQQQTHVDKRLQAVIHNATGPARKFLEGYRSVLNAIHNSASYDYARKNLGKAPPMVELARKARNLTGDPRIGGQFTTGGKVIRFENENFGRVGKTAQAFAKGYGRITEIGRQSVPWFNATAQGIKRLGQAYLENPVKFTTMMWLYQGAPAATFYLWTRGLGKDPNGLSYTDFQMNRRSEYNKTMNWYIPIPGRPAEEGMEVPRFHEMTPIAHMTEIALDHALRSSIFTESEDINRAAGNFLKIILDPPLPSWMTLPMAASGIQPPQGLFELMSPVFGGKNSTYQPRQDTYDQLGGMPKSIEMLVRATFPGIGDVVGSGYAAYTQTPDGFLKGIKNAYTEAGRRVITKTPIVRDIANVHAPILGVNAINEEMQDRRNVLKQLEEYYKEWTVGSGDIGAKHGRSLEGGKLAVERLGEPPPLSGVGIKQPEPTNPLYNYFIEALHNRFVKDAPHDRKGKDTGAIGFPSLMDRYGKLSRDLRRLRKVNDGNYVTWQKQLQAEPESVAYLKKNNIDPTNLNQIRNFYEKKRQDAARYILFTIRSVEKELSGAVGRPIKLEDIKPYGKGLEEDRGLFDEGDEPY